MKLRIFSFVFIIFTLVACASTKDYKTLEKAPVGKISFDSVTLSQTQFLKGSKTGKKVKIYGELTIPESSNDRIPAVILLHGSAGVGTREIRWANEIRKTGIATFIVDCFTPRGIGSTGKKQFQLTSLAMIKDAYRTLELLSTHPKIDSSKIAIMGFSKGGISSLYSSLYRFYRSHGPSTNIFAAHIAFYPFCGYIFLDETETSYRPIRIFMGTDDDYVSLESCKDYVDRLKKAGRDIEIIELENAKHGFDNPEWIDKYEPRAMNLSKCVLVEEKEGMIIVEDTGQPFSPKANCIYRGAHISYNEESFQKSVKIIKEFLIGLFGLD